MQYELTATETKWVWRLAVAVILLSWTSIKIAMPALPRLEEVFHTSGGIKLSVTIYFIAFGLSQPFWGGIAQRIGCRKAILIGLLVAIIGSFIAMLAFDLPTFIVGRTLEGLGMGSASPIGRTLLTDILSREDLARSMGMVSGLASLMPAVAPLIGGYLLAWIDWRAIFGFFLILSTVYFGFAFRQLPETRVLSKEDRPSFCELSGYYASILRSKKFWAYCTAYSTMTGGMLGYYSAMPYWYVSQLGISENHYAYLTIPTVAFYISGLLLNRNGVKRMGLDKLLLIGLAIAVSTAVLNITLAAMQVSGLIALVGLLSLFGFSAGLVMPSASAGATADFRAIAGPASALLTTGVFLASSITATWAMRIDIATLWPVAGYLATLSVVGFSVAGFGVWLPRRKLKAPGTVS